MAQLALFAPMDLHFNASLHSNFVQQTPPKFGIQISAKNEFPNLAVYTRSVPKL
jgi:hypothetical protein